MVERVAFDEEALRAAYDRVVGDAAKFDPGEADELCAVIGTYLDDAERERVMSPLGQ